MEKYGYIAGVAILAAGCGNTNLFTNSYQPHNADLHLYNDNPVLSLPVKVDIITGGYEVDCTEKNLKLPPDLDRKKYCNNREQGEIEPFIYATYREQMVDLLNCMYGGLFSFEIKEDKNQKLQRQALFFGGSSVSSAGGTISTWDNGEFILYSFNRNTVKEPITFYDAIVIATHELGHALVYITVNQIGKNGPRIMQQYGLDSHGHNITSKSSIMHASGADYVLNFDHNTARFIADNIDLSRTGLSKAQVMVKLTTIDQRCITGINKAKELLKP
jgi:hypothetical protein